MNDLTIADLRKAKQILDANPTPPDLYFVGDSKTMLRRVGFRLKPLPLSRKRLRKLRRQNYNRFTHERRTIADKFFGATARIETVQDDATGLLFRKTIWNGPTIETVSLDFIGVAGTVGPPGCALTESHLE